MRRKDTQSISDILKQFSRDPKFDRHLLETQIINNWSKVLGSGIADSTRNIYITNRTLFVSIDSSVMRHELFMIRSQIQKALNDSVGTHVIDNIIFR